MERERLSESKELSLINDPPDSIDGPHDRNTANVKTFQNLRLSSSNKNETSSSSASNSSNSSDSDSCSTSGSDSSSSDEDENRIKDHPSITKENKKAAPVFGTESCVKAPAAEGGAESQKSTSALTSKASNIVVSGSVINNTVRVVPIKEKKRRVSKQKENKEVGERKLLSIKEKKKDPDFKFKGILKFESPAHSENACNTSVTTSNAGTVPAIVADDHETSIPGTSSTSTPAGASESQPSTSAQRSLRARTKTPIFNESYIFQLQQEILQEELRRGKRDKGTSENSRKRSPLAGRKRGRKGKGDNKSLEEELDITEVDSDGPKTYLRRSGKTADWDDYLKNLKHVEWILPVNFFKHAPFTQKWLEFAIVGTKIEIPNPFVVCDKPVYWVATIQGFAGYKALVEYESFGMSTGFFGWISYCSDVPKPIGYCDRNRILLFPPNEVYSKHKDFLKKMRSILQKPDVKTIPEDHHKIVQQEILALRRYNLMDPVEAIDGIKVDRKRVGNITGMIGDRIYVSFPANKDASPGFWFNCRSDQVHRIGWSQTVGSKPYGCSKKAVFPKLSPDSFPEHPQGMKIKKGMVFEVIHPILLNRIAVAHVEATFKYGYFMAQVESGVDFQNTNFCFHSTSNWLLPCGFSVRNDIPLILPDDENPAHFNWDNYCARKRVERLDLSSLLPRPQHKFVRGSKMESIDLRQPSFCGPVTVRKVAEHLLLLHFDGWPRDLPQALQWVDAESPDIYPVGWAEMVGHEFQSRPDPPHPDDNPGAIAAMDEETLTQAAGENERIPISSDVDE